MQIFLLHQLFKSVYFLILTPGGGLCVSGWNCDRSHNPARTVPANAAASRWKLRAFPSLGNPSGHGRSHRGADLSGGAPSQEGTEICPPQGACSTTQLLICANTHTAIISQGKYSVYVYSVNGHLLSSFTTEEQMSALHLVSEYVILGTRQGSLHIRDLFR